MRKPPDDTHGMTWGTGSVIVSTRYVVRGALGRGGMGSVYEAQHLDTGQVYAFKVLSTRVAEHDALAERVVREAEFLRLMNDTPHVVTVVDCGRLRDAYRRPYLVMQRLYGHPLAALLVRRALPVADALAYVRQVLWGLAAVHGAGGLHRDIKPSNLFVQDDGTCTLLDFGVMKALSEIGLSPRLFITDKDVPIGTPSYMAPEMASGVVVDHRADLFSVGLVLLECLLGFRLWPDLSKDAYLERLVNEGVPSLELIGGGHLPAEVQRLVRRATLPDPAKRFPTALAMVAAIDRLAAALGLSLRPVPPSEHLGAGGWPPPRLFRPDATTWSAGTAGGAAPRPRTPSERTTSGRGAAVGPAARRTPSAWPTRVDSVSPTRVDSVSPTRVKAPAPRGGAAPTPAPASGDALTPPLESQRRLRWRGLFWGRGDGAPGAMPTPPVGSPERPTTTLPLPPRSGVSWRLPRLRDRLASVPDMDATPINDVLEGPALAAPALAPPAAPKPHRGAFVAAGPLWARRVPLASAAVAFGAAGVAVGIVASLAVSSWGGPSAVMHVAPEPRRGAPAGVVAPAEAPSLEPPAESRPPEVSPPDRPPNAPASSARGTRRAQLEAKLQSGRGTVEDADALAGLCSNAGDELCVRRAQAFREKLRGTR